MSTLDTMLLAAHASGDGVALAGLYQEAARQAITTDAGAFYLTQAHIFALERGLESAQTLRAELVTMGREALPAPPRPPLR